MQPSPEDAVANPSQPIMQVHTVNESHSPVSVSDHIDGDFKEYLLRRTNKGDKALSLLSEGDLVKIVKATRSKDGTVQTQQRFMVKKEAILGVSHNKFDWLDRFKLGWWGMFAGGLTLTLVGGAFATLGPTLFGAGLVLSAWQFADPEMIVLETTTGRHRLFMNRMGSDRELMACSMDNFSNSVQSLLTDGDMDTSSYDASVEELMLGRAAKMQEAAAQAAAAQQMQMQQQMQQQQQMQMQQQMQPAMVVQGQPGQLVAPQPGQVVEPAPPPAAALEQPPLPAPAPPAESPESAELPPTDSPSESSEQESEPAPPSGEVEDDSSEELPAPEPPEQSEGIQHPPPPPAPNPPANLSPVQPPAAPLPPPPAPMPLPPAPGIEFPSDPPFSEDPLVMDADAELPPPPEAVVSGSPREDNMSTAEKDDLLSMLDD